VISPRTETIMTAFGIAGWLLVTIIVVCKILQSATKDLFERQRKWLNHRNLTLDATTVNSFRIWLALGATILILLIVHFWAFFRLRRFQSDMNEAAGAEFPDGHWTFGQIVSVVVFFPAVVEVSFLWTKQSLYCN
jgi:amino acid transporter